ncbi:MFS transporter [Pedosphaera parvula]|uniref:Major facilitator superfamily MFS_1 n=1 Tax=Pedosphaera parvula (strain Ellin514) TaxID=320771 RepID=B9XQS1_PEDPL|nr:MFS transporter [Pedosphaera parvula]EEF57778.1 major facilitator superfamily MFS_1 [Pedosphaera parvula Ellin514]
MLEAAEQVVLTSRTPPPDLTGLRRRLRIGYFTLEALNGLAAPFYFNYLFFYMRQHFGFENRHNLMLTALHGFFYMFSAYKAGSFAQKRGYFFSLRLGFSGMGLALVIGALLPHFWGYSRTTMFLELPVLILWTLSMCLTWPILQALLTQHQPPTRLPRTAGIYNIVWATGAAIAYLTGGALLEKFGGEILLWLAAGLHGIELLLLPRLQKMHAIAEAAPQETALEPSIPLPALNPRPISKARNFLHLAWLANPFAYVAINGILPVIPKLTAGLGLSEASAGIICSVWFWVRLCAFILFWRWTGWHYRFGWLLCAFIALIVGFIGILLSSHIWLLVGAQVIFGLAVGLIYYSSLFYSMDAGESNGKKGGIHEAAIGIGVFTGPTIGVSTLFLFQGQSNAGTYGISALLGVGLLALIWLRSRKI